MWFDLLLIFLVLLPLMPLSRIHRRKAETVAHVEDQPRLAAWPMRH